MWTNTSLNSNMTMTAYRRCFWKNNTQSEGYVNAGQLMSDDEDITYTFYANSRRLIYHDIMVTFYYNYAGKTMNTTNGFHCTNAN
jgi:hypothetical protein